MPFQAICPIDSLWDGEMTGVEIDNEKILLVRVSGEVHAFQDKCRHQAVELHTGVFRDGVITCPAHQWQYDARTGQGINPNDVCLISYAVKEQNGMILVNIGDLSGEKHL